MCNTGDDLKRFPLSLYVTDLSYPDDFYDRWYSLLPENRRHKADNIKNEATRRRCIAAYALLEYALRDLDKRVGLDCRSIAKGRFATKEGENGKPYFTDIPVFFNISHSGDRIAVALASGEAGCDVEHKCSGELSIAKRFFTREEYEALASIEDEKERKTFFKRLWTLKESVVKCSGEGILRPLDDFSLIDEGQKIRDSIKLGDIDAKLYIKEYEEENGYCYSACCTYADMEDTVRKVRIE